jgi:hypothetical protein
MNALFAAEGKQYVGEARLFDGGTGMSDSERLHTGNLR